MTDAEIIAAALGGSRSGTGFIARCPLPSHGKGRGDRNPSLSLRDDAGKLLLCCHAGCDTINILHLLRERGILRSGGRPSTSNVHQLPYIRPSAASAAVIPLPNEEFLNSFCKAGYTATYLHEYVTADGVQTNLVVRYEKPESQKRFLQFTKVGGEWKLGGPRRPVPLYCLPLLARHPQAKILIVEGELTAAAAAKHFPQLVVLTTMGGAQSPQKTDFTPLSGREVTIWPDADTPGSTYAAKVVKLASNAGAKSVKVVQLPDGLDDGWDLADEIPKNLNIFTLYNEAVDLIKSKEEDDVDLTLLGTGRRRAPAFPVDLLGEFWAKWATENAEAASSPVDYVIASLLAAAGATLANVRRPLAGEGWSEPPVLWVAIVGSSTAGKSPALDRAMALLRYAEEIICEGFGETVREFETKKQSAIAKREVWEGEVKSATKLKDAPPPLPIEAMLPHEPVRPRIRIGDCTTEKMAAMAASMPRGLILVRDEIAGWISGFGRYGGGGGGSDRAFAVEMYGGRPYVVDRVKNREPISIERLSIAVLGGIQPDKLPLIVDGPDDGLASRFLMVWPDTKPAFKLNRRRVDDMPAKMAFGRLVRLGVSDNMIGDACPVEVPLSVGAEEVIERFAQDMEARGANASGLHANVFGKARGHVLRLSAILEYLWWSEGDCSEPSSISTAAVSTAVAFMEGYFIPMAECAYGDAFVPSVERNAMRLIRYIKKNDLQSFNAREIRQNIGGDLRDSKNMDGACDTLVEAGLIRPDFHRAGSTPGRRRKSYSVASKVFEYPDERCQKSEGSEAIAPLLPSKPK